MLSPDGRAERAALRTALVARWPWVADTDHGPSSVAAGECDACGAEPRLVAPCGPAPARVRQAAGGRTGRGLGQDWALGRRCLVVLADEAFCAGHADQAAAEAAWAAGLDAEADVVTRLWWVATGEVRLDPALRLAVSQLGLPVAAGTGRPPGPGA